MPYKVSLESLSGALEVRVVYRRDDIRLVALDIVSATPFMVPGDKILVCEVDKDNAHINFRRSRLNEPS